MPSTTKVCTLCGGRKELTDFYRATKATDGHQARCKACHRERVRDYRSRLRSRNSTQPPDIAQVKMCPRCGVEKLGSEFHRNRSTTDGLHWVCRMCNGVSIEYRRDIEQRRRFRIYDVSPQQVLELLAHQGNACAICRRPFRGTSFHIDHCHRTDGVRGLLCGRCNTGIGLLGDDVARLSAAIVYLAAPPMSMITALK